MSKSLRNCLILCVCGALLLTVILRYGQSPLTVPIVLIDSDGKCVSVLVVDDGKEVNKTCLYKYTWIDKEKIPYQKMYVASAK